MNYPFKIVLSLLFINLFSSISYAQENTFKIISYNVYWGMRQDSTEKKSKFAEWIKQQNPDIIALQEMNGFSQQELQVFAESYGHPYAFIVREPFADGSISFPVAITSRYPIVNVNRVVENTVHGFITGEVEGLHFIVTHFHPFSSEKRGYEIDQILATLKSKTEVSKWLLMGDLNSVSPLDKLEYDNNLLRDFIREDRIKRLYNQNLKNNELDYSVQQKILDYGFVDAFKLFNADFVPSAPTKLFYDQSKHPLRYDYFYISAALKEKLVSSEIIKDDFTDVFSDHYPVQIILKK